MDNSMNLNVKEIAAKIEAELRALPVRNIPNEREIRRKYSQMLKKANPEFILNLASELKEKCRYRVFAYELIRSHKEAFQSIGEKELEEFGRGINSLWSVDAFARTLAGPAWLRGQVTDGLIHKWAHSEDLWWRRAALVSTVALNMRSQGGMGDALRTLEVCCLLVDDHDDMVVKAMSWALRVLVVHDPGEVSEFLNKNEDVLAARVKREVQNKLTTGLKNPKKRG